MIESSNFTSKEACPYEPNRLLAPLSIESDRRDVQRRLVGPIAAIATLGAIEGFRDLDLIPQSQLINSQDLQPDRYEDVYYHASARFRATRHNLTEATWANYGRDARGTYPIHDPYVTSEQQVLFDSFTFNKNLPDIVEEGFATQFNLTFNLALPGYLASSQNLKNGASIAGYVQSIGKEGVAETIANPEFVKSLSALAITANGLYGQISNPYTDKPRGFPVLQFPDQQLRLQKVRDLKSKVKLNIYDLYETDQAGATALSEATVKSLKKYINLRNKVLNEEDSLADMTGATKGCPVVQRVAYLRPDDLTTYQWRDLTTGDNPIAQYNAKTKKVSFMRSAIEETNQLFVDLLSA